MDEMYSKYDYPITSMCKFPMNCGGGDKEPDYEPPPDPPKTTDNAAAEREAEEERRRLRAMKGRKSTQHGTLAGNAPVTKKLLGA